MERKKISGIQILKNFFTNLKDKNDINSFTINCLNNIIDFLELLFWDKLNQNLDKTFCEEIDDKIKNQINIYFDKNNNEAKNNLKFDLCSIIRRFICRYLIIKIDENINPTKNLNTFLTNIGLWSFKLENNKNMEEEINKIFSGINIEIRHAFKLYQYLGGEESILGKYNLINKKENNEIDNKINKDENNKYKENNEIDNEKNNIDEDNKYNENKIDAGLINVDLSNGENNRIENNEENEDNNNNINEINNDIDDNDDDDDSEDSSSENENENNNAIVEYNPY